MGYGPLVGSHRGEKVVDLSTAQCHTGTALPSGDVDQSLVCQTLINKTVWLKNVGNA